MKDIFKITTRTTEKELALMSLCRELQNKLNILEIYANGEEDIQNTTKRLLDKNAELTKQIETVRQANRELAKMINKEKKERQSNLTQAEKDQIAELYAYLTIPELARAYNCTNNTIINILMSKDLYVRSNKPGRPKIEGGN